MFGGGCGKVAMKRSESELTLEEVVRMTTMIAPPDTPSGDPHKAGIDHSAFLAPTSFAADPEPPFKTWEMAHGDVLSSGGLVAPCWIETLLSGQPSTQPTNQTPTDSLSLMFVGSPMSVSKPNMRAHQGRDVSGGSSDDDDGEIELGSCEQSADPGDKHSRRRISNRESAKRSRKRKQEHVVGLEEQVENLRGENDTLFKHLAVASQQFRDANTNNQVLKSNVEALRAKVKLAQDMVTRGSLNCNFNQLLQNQNLQPTVNTCSSMSTTANVSPTITVKGDNNPSYTCTNDGSTVMRQHSCLRVGNEDPGNNNMTNRLAGEAVSCASDIWP